jgi:hypothetical protein
MSHKHTDTEKRSYSHAVELRAMTQEGEAHGRTLYGYAAVFNTRAQIVDFIGGQFRKFEEEILPESISDDIIRRSDCRALFNHNPDNLLARSKYGEGTLRLWIDSRGLGYEFEAPQSRADIVEMVQRGDLDQNSFGFIVDMDVWSKTDTGDDLRSIKRIREVSDISLATYPAYVEAGAAIRSLQDMERAQATEYLMKARQRELQILELLY